MVYLFLVRWWWNVFTSTIPPYLPNLSYYPLFKCLLNFLEIIPRYHRFVLSRKYLIFIEDFSRIERISDYLVSICRWYASRCIAQAQNTYCLWYELCGVTGRLSIQHHFPQSFYYSKFVSICCNRSTHLVICISSRSNSWQPSLMNFTQHSAFCVLCQIEYVLICHSCFYAKYKSCIVWKIHSTARDNTFDLSLL